MREIKFRGYDVDEFIYSDNVGVDRCLMTGNYGQYTGLKDKNGKESFEGDIFIYDYEKYIIKYHNIFAGFYGETLDGKGIYKYDYDLEGFDDCEIIGNIYETPNLITK